MIWKSKQSRDRDRKGSADAVQRRPRGPERLEARRLFAADPIHIGVVYLETDYLESDQDVGSDSHGDRFLLSFSGGAPNTELSELRIRTDKDGDGISVGDPLFDTEPGGRGKNGAHGFRVVRVVTTDGRNVEATAEVEDGGQELVLRLANFQAGDRLEFTVDVDEVLRNAIDLAVFNSRLDVITSGQEFQDSIIEATFDAPHYETSHADAIFLNDFGDPASEYDLNLPADEGDDVDSRPNRSAAAIAATQQTAKPIDISGQVWIDNNLDKIRQAHETLVPNVELALWRRGDSGAYQDTGHRVRAGNDGVYIFPKSLGLQPGTYRMVQTQPEGLLSVGAVVGQVGGARVGLVESENVLSEIEIPLGDTSAVRYDFAEAQPASLSGYVYQDNDDDGRRDLSEPGIAGVQVQLVPIHTIANASVLTVTSASDGSYSFTGLAPGTYEVIEVDQPVTLNDGIDSVGTVGGRTVGAVAPAGDRLVNILLAGADKGVEYNFGEVPYGSLSGFVFLAAPGEDCDGVHAADGTTVIPGVEIVLQTSLGETVARTTTGADGGYLFDNVPIGDYRIVEFTPNGLIDGSSHVGRIGRVTVGSATDGGLITNITMTPAGVGVDYNFCEAAPASISGFVYHDRGNNGKRDPDDESIAGVRITLVDAAGISIATTETDTSGHYEFDSIAPGQYSILESQPPGYFDGIDSIGSIDGQAVGELIDEDTLSAITLHQGQSGVEYNFGELIPASLFGRVHVDVDGDCELDPDEETLTDVTIQLLDSTGNEVARTQTNSSGQYAFTDLAPGTYTIVQQQPYGYFEGNASVGSAGGQAIGGSQIGSITLTSGETAVEYDFCERPGAEISGSVFSDRDGDCTFDTDEKGIEGAWVELYNEAGELVAAKATDASGNYRFTNLPAGNYILIETQPAGYLQGGQRAGSGGGDDSVDNVISRIPIGWGERLTEYVFCELEPSSISGTVFVDGNGDCLQDEDEPPLEGVAIELRDAGGRTVANTTTDANGAYHFDNLAPGSYQIFELQPDGVFQGGQMIGTGGGEILGEDLFGLQLSAGIDVVDYTFCEVRPSSIAGSVWQENEPNQRYEPGDVPIPGVLIELIDDASDDKRVLATTRTDAAGNYLFASLAPGVYSVREHQPAGLFHGGEVVGDSGGAKSGDDLLVGIVLRGTTATQYDFPEVPPATISGFVFQDGEVLKTSVVPEPTELRQFRDGLLTQDDTRLGGVTIELRNVLGQPFDASRAMAGVYPDGPIRVTTDADGYYEFAGLRPGTYHVYQVQPDDFVDGLDTPGTTGGLAVNPADKLDEENEIIIQTLASSRDSDPNDDAILLISLAGGSHSQENNFSEIVVVPNPVPQLVDEPRLKDEAPTTPIETFDPRIRLVAFAQPVAYRTENHSYDEWAVSWHLSVINGGFPRGQDGAPSTEGIIRSVSSKQMTKEEWTEGEHSDGLWTIADRKGNLTGLGDEFDLGAEGATALAGDFDGDGSDEAVIYVGGQWFVDLNGNGRWDAGDMWIQLGTALDRPVVGDWDGDGKDDIGIFGRQWQRDQQRIKQDPGLPDPANKRRRNTDSSTVTHRGEGRGEDRQRLLRRGDEQLRADAVDHVFEYGEQVDTPIAGDWNGDGIDQIAAFRSGNWMLDSDGDGRWTARDEFAKYGRSGDQPIVGDFNGDEIDEIGIVRGDLWIIDTDGDRRITGNDLRIEVPRSSDDSQPIVGDFDGDGKDEPGYYDEAA